MEMDNFRSRSFDRSNSRQPGLTKKPRLAEDLTSNNNNRPFSSRPPPPSSQPPSAAGAVSARFRGDRDSDSNDSSRGGAGGGGYQPQNLQQQQQQHQELINQYKAALDELTFNSKPIITNLTIIAGENLLAAKAIASAICGNILEVPSDQKLPSLYLLDSIVKNIGRDYIKHFGAKLPEVFCKTYRQVESSLQSSMRHLFGTWKGVFPPQSLQMIEKELGFTTAANGSSSGTTASRPDSQSLRQPQSIHVNPKYLEARQQLQQSSRAKGTNDISGTLAKDAERPDRSSSIIGGRPWADRSVNKQSVQHLQRETTRQHEKSSSVSYEDYDYDSELSGRLGKRIGRDSVSITEPGQNKQIYGARSSVAETVPRQRNGFDIKDKVPNFMAPRVANSEMSRSWKNSEEDEYMWDDLNSRLMDYPAVNNSTKARSSSDKLERGSYLRRSQHDVGSRTDRESSVDSLSTEMENQTTFSHPVSPQLPVPVLQAADPRRLLVAANSSLARAKLQTQLESSHKGSSGVGFSKKSLTSDASPPRKSAILQRHLSSSLSALPPQRELHHFDEQELPQAESLKKSQGTKPQKSAPVLHPLQRRQSSSTQQPKLEQKQSETPSDAQKPPMVQASMDVILKSGILSKGSQPKLDSLDTNAMPSELGIPRLPSGSSSTQLASSAGTKVSNPLSNLLSSLVAKGLISSSNTDTPKIVPSKVPIASSSSKPLPSLPVSSVPVSTSSSEVSVFKPSTKPLVSITQSITTDIKKFIGFEFKPDKIREFHPSVITDLFDDLPHQCTICGLRLKLEERLDRHLEWHASQKNASKSASREWFVNSGNWVSREVKATPKREPVDFIEETGNVVEMIEQQNHPMVPADEDQCLCILCGELFEDFYCQESDQWMFKGAAYMPQGLIVHAECMSDNSAHDLGMTDAVKVVDFDL